MENIIKPTLILGATTNPTRYAFLAAQSLTQKGHEIFPMGIKRGEVAGKTIQDRIDPGTHIDTITLYLNARNQEQYYDYILKELKPKRLIFNPGAENPALAQLARSQGIHVENACTLVMLSVGNY